jgi:hypothetical protein
MGGGVGRERGTERLRRGEAGGEGTGRSAVRIHSGITTH